MVAGRAARFYGLRRLGGRSLSNLRRLGSSWTTRAHRLEHGLRPDWAQSAATQKPRTVPE
jgi:hypothetical protein